MPLEVMLGLPGDGVSQQLRDAVAIAGNARTPALLALPDAAGAAGARAAVSGSAPAGVRIATLQGVVEAEWALLGDGRRLVTALARDILLARALIAAGVSSRPGRGAVALLAALAEGAEGTPASVRGDELPDRLVRALALYREALREHGMVERAEACTLLGRERPPADVIVIDGFRSLPRDFEALLTGWSGNGARVLIGLPGSASISGEDPWPLLSRLRASGALFVSANATRIRPPELQRVVAGLFSNAEPGPATGAVRCAVVEGEEGEARFVAETAAGLIAAGAEPSTITIAFADPARHAGWMRRALRDAGVDADVRSAVAVGETPFGAALLGLRACAAGGLERRDLSALMRTSFSGVPIRDADATDVAWRRGSTPSGRGLLRHVIRLEPVLTQVGALLKRPIGAAESAKWKKLADELFANGYPGASPVPAEDGYLDAAVHRAFCRGLQEAVELGEGEVSADEFWDRFATSRIEPLVAPRAGKVLVTGIDAVPPEGVAHLIIGGLTSSEFPRRGSADRFEGDSVAKAMTRLGIPFEPEEQSREERRAFLIAVASAEQSLTLVRRGTDDEGGALRESVFWDEFLDLYRRPGEPAPVGKPLVQAVIAEASAATGRSRSERGRLHDDDAIAELATTAEVSPSEVEAYVSCPYKWFVGRRLRADAPDREVDVAAVGRLAHEALARFYREWQQRGRRRVTPATVGAAAALMAEIAAGIVRQAGQPDDLETSTLLDSVQPAVEALIRRDSEFLPGYEPAYLEWAFGRDSGVPAFDLGSGVSLVGRADRIDIGPEGLVVVDYKRTTAHPVAQIRARGLVQLQLYAAAASAALGSPVAGGLYRSLKDGVDRGFVLTDAWEGASRNDVLERDEIDGLLAAAVQSAVGAAAGMREGRIAPTPSPEACRFCPASTFCGVVMTR